MSYRAPVNSRSVCFTWFGWGFILNRKPSHTLDLDLYYMSDRIRIGKEFRFRSTSLVEMRSGRVNLIQTIYLYLAHHISRYRTPLINAEIDQKLTMFCRQSQKSSLYPPINSSVSDSAELLRVSRVRIRNKQTLSLRQTTQIIDSSNLEFIMGGQQTSHSRFRFN